MLVGNFCIGVARGAGQQVAPITNDDISLLSNHKRHFYQDAEQKSKATLAVSLCLSLQTVVNLILPEYI